MRSAPPVQRPASDKKPGPATRDGAGERPGLAARVAASRLLAAVIDAGTPLDGLTDDGHGHVLYRALDPRDRSLVRAILLSALRHRGTITAILEKRLDRPLPQKAHTLSHILHVAAAQILYLDVPDSAAVDLAVSHASSDPRTRRFAPLVNAVLRTIIRKAKPNLPAIAAKTMDAPQWFNARLVGDYGDETAAAILKMHRHEAPVDFTVKGDPAQWAEELGGIVVPSGSIRVARPKAPISELPGYAEGAWWVQDAAAALPARLMGDVAGKRVADLCAAPGGKTAQLIMAGADVTAIDISANRLKRLAANLERLGLEAQIIASDLRTYQPEALFDAVLLDAPCSATGTVRRHPDVMWTKSPEMIDRLAGIQRELLGHAVRLVKPGGTVIFANCSLAKQEGEELIAAFVEEHQNVTLVPADPGLIDDAIGFIDASGFLRTTPADWAFDTPALSGLDGFFSAQLKRA